MLSRGVGDDERGSSGRATPRALYFFLAKAVRLGNFYPTLLNILQAIVRANAKLKGAGGSGGAVAAYRSLSA